MFKNKIIIPNQTNFAPNQLYPNPDEKKKSFKENVA
jgi:hypothetical protein